MTANEIRTAARALTVETLTAVFDANDAVQFADASWAILQNVDGQEVWTEITVKSKAYKPTKVSDVFDPFVAAEGWKEQKRIKAEKKAAENAEKAKKVAKAKEKEKEKDE